jgi:hypothetical protein
MPERECILLKTVSVSSVIILPSSCLDYLALSPPVSVLKMIPLWMSP